MLELTQKSELTLQKPQRQTLALLCVLSLHLQGKKGGALITQAADAALGARGHKERGEEMLFFFIRVSY